MYSPSVLPPVGPQLYYMYLPMPLPRGQKDTLENSHFPDNKNISIYIYIICTSYIYVYHIQLTLVTMAPVGTGQKWHSVTRFDSNECV